MSTASRLITGEELLAMGDIGRSELIYGEVVRMSPSGFAHGHATARLAQVLGTWNQHHKLGVVLGAETGFRLQRNPDLVRAPDASFVERGRIGSVWPSGFFEGAPDLAVEVVSPSDPWPEVEEKIDMWLAHGCRSCWVVDPKNRQVSLHRPDGSIRKIKGSEKLEDSVLPGFHASVATLFEP